jgi:hypothetical protein
MTEPNVTPTEELYSLWVGEGWKHGYRHAFELAAQWGYDQRKKEEDSTVNR